MLKIQFVLLLLAMLTACADNPTKNSGTPQTDMAATDASIIDMLGAPDTGVDADPDLSPAVGTLEPVPADPPDLRRDTRPLIFAGGASSFIEGLRNQRAFLRNGLGFDAVLYTAPEPRETDGFDFLIVNENVPGTVYGDRYRDETLPLILMKSTLYDEHSFVAEAEVTTIDEENVLQIVGDSALTERLPDSFSYVDGTPTTATIAAVGDGVPFATMNDASWGVTYEVGAATATAFAVPERRVLLPIETSSLPELTNDGWQLFENAVHWVDPTERTAATPSGTIAVIEDAFGAATAIILRRLRRLGFGTSLLSSSELADVDLTSLDGIVLGASVDPSLVDLGSFAGGVLSFRPNAPGTRQTAQIFTGIPNYIVRENSRQLADDPISLRFEPRDEITGEAVIVAHIAPEEVVIYAHNVGAVLDGSATVGRRITFTLPVQSIDRDSMELFDRSALWAFDLGQ